MPPATAEPIAPDVEAIEEIVSALETEKAAIQATASGPPRRTYTDEERERLKQLTRALSGKATEEEIRGAYAAGLLADEEPAEPAAELASADEPPRPEGAADDEWEYNDSEGPRPDADGSTVDPAAHEDLDDPAFRERLKETSGVAGDHAEARGELDGYVPGQEGAEPAGAEPDDEEEALFPVPSPYDEKLYAELIGGEQPTEFKIAVKGLPSLTLENAPAHLKKGMVLEARVRLQVTGRADDDKLKHNLESEELEITKTVEKHTLTVTAAAVVDDG